MSDLAVVLPVSSCDLGGSPAAPDLADLPLDALRAHRRELLAEAARASRWRRLVQARLDLAVDVAAPVDDLAGACPRLRDVVSGPHPANLPVVEEDPITVLRRVEAARADLARYAARLGEQLDAATGELVDRYAREPGTCLEPVSGPGGAGGRRRG